MLKAIFFDAVGTLFHLPRGVGYHYALAGKWVGLQLNAKELDRAFALAWKETTSRPAIGRPREDDDKGWWRELTGRVLDQVSPGTAELDRDAFFETVYGHFAEANVWELYPDVISVLEALKGRFDLSVISNFDGRLRIVLERLGVSRFFGHVFVSSELGADKPDPAIYRCAVEIIQLPPGEVLHVGDDSKRDWQAAARAGLQVFKLDRAKNSLRDLLSIL
jgi:putative hydrolase of the HAD superfamily